MNKFIKCWVFIICLLFIFLILFTDNVKAETCAYNYKNELTPVLSVNKTIQNGTNSFTIDLNGNLNVGTSYNTIILNAWYSILSTNNTMQTNVNYEETCSTNFDRYTSNTITYADGTHASIDSDTPTWCSRFQGIATETTTYNYIPTINKISINLIDTNNNITPCINSGDNQFKCTNTSNTSKNYKQIRFDIIGNYSQGTNVRFGLLSRSIAFCQSDTKEIINNQNQNAQQQHNDLQQQYNFISNSTVDTTTIDNINNIDVSNSDTKNAVTNFALIPLNFMQTIINSFSSSCSQVCIGECGGSSGGGHDNAWRFIFPCLDIEGIVGSNIYAIIDSLFAFGMVFAFIRSVRKFFINALLLTTDASSEVGVFL